MGPRNVPILLCRRLLVLGLTALATSGQGAEPAAKFEVADIHPSPRSLNSDTNDLSGGMMRSGRYNLRRATMLDLVRIAYGVDAKTILGGPNWLALDRFDIRAKAPAGTNSAAVKPMLRTLLTERFGLLVHNDNQPLSMWALTAGKHPLMKKSDGSGESGCHSSGSGDVVDVKCRNMTMAAFASGMGGLDGAWYYLTDNRVADQTGLEGAWDFDLRYSARWKTTIAGAEIVSLFDAIDKLGLKLDASMIPTPVVLVDGVNRTPTPNSPDVDKLLPPAPTEFEAVDVKPTDPDYHDSDVQLQEGGRLKARGMTLKSLIAGAWGITEEMIVDAPKFLDSDRWDIVAKAPDVMAADGDADFDSLLMMVRNLLADRFRLSVHFEDRPVQAYTMTAPKPRMKKADPASRTGCKEGPPTLVKIDPRGINPVLGRYLTCTNVSMAYLAQQLQFLASGYIHSDVLDATGLEGGWDFTLSFSKLAQLRGNGALAQAAGSASDPNGALSVQDAMEKQLGLKLELRKRPASVLVIDRIEEKPSDN